MKLAGSVALVTGANRGLGAVFVRELLARGAKVYASARDVARLASVVTADRDRIVPIHLDVTDERSVAAAADVARDVTLLVNNAGRLDQLSLGEAGNLEPLRGEMEVNVFGLARMCLAVAPIIGRNGGGAIVNMLSVSSIVPVPWFGTYSATKAAAMSLTHTMRWDFQPLGVTVVGLYAGLIDTEMVANIDSSKVSAASVVARALDGIERGEVDIATDERCEAARKQFHFGLEDFLRQSRERSTAMRAKHPVRPTTQAKC